MYYIVKTDKSFNQANEPSGYLSDVSKRLLEIAGLEEVTWTQLERLTS